MLGIFIFLIVIPVIIYFLLNRNVEKRAGIYSVPTIFFPLKLALMKVVSARRQQKAKSQQPQNDAVIYLEIKITYKPLEFED